ncbi:YagE family protein [Saccharata proteae CBS 121410]|uniref:YagE family protein n=1 Tax=Saccharata proteae CBS 121410 TaxID=1314787 RepID=A0A9P4HMW7_9PEZI|nr:YagE family protein [Saccharata proteae CBS 121410]
MLHIRYRAIPCAARWTKNQLEHATLRSSPQHVHNLRTVGLNRDFSSLGALRKNPNGGQEHPVNENFPEELKQEKQKRAKADATKSTLRKVAVEAQKKRLKKPTTDREVDRDGEEAKKVTAYCAADKYNISTVARLVAAAGYDIDPYQTGLYPQVVHIRIANAIESVETGDIFIFPSGTVVAWNVSDRITLRLVSKILVPAAEKSHIDIMETEDMSYIEDPNRDISDISGDNIILGTRVPANPPEDQAQSNEVDTVLTKIAFSSGLARSTKLAILEGLLNSYFDSTRSIPEVLSRGSRLRFTRKFILMKTGELLNIRAQLNLYSELTDSLPDLFWDSRQELGLEDYYSKVGRALDVNVRIRSLNDKLTYAQDIASVLSARLEEKHGHVLEWIIIWLIAFEICLELHRLWRERSDHYDPESTENRHVS